MNCQEQLVINVFVNILRVKILRTVMDYFVKFMKISPLKKPTIIW